MVSRFECWFPTSGETICAGSCRSELMVCRCDTSLVEMSLDEDVVLVVKQQLKLQDRRKKRSATRRL